MKRLCLAVIGVCHNAMRLTLTELTRNAILLASCSESRLQAVLQRRMDPAPRERGTQTLHLRFIPILAVIGAPVTCAPDALRLFQTRLCQILGRAAPWPNQSRSA